MAKVTMPLMSLDARGSVSGIQYSRNRSGAFGSRKSTSSHKQGDAVTNHRALLKQAHTRWDTLSDALRAQWEQHSSPTEAGRNAYIGAELRNLTAGADQCSKSPLETPSYDVIVNLQARIPDAGAPRVRITWDFMFEMNAVLLGYWHFPRGQHISHVRKFKFGKSMDLDVPNDDYPIPYRPGFVAIRLIYWQPQHGVIISEWRALLIGSAWVQITPA